MINKLFTRREEVVPLNKMKGTTPSFQKRSLIMRNVALTVLKMLADRDKIMNVKRIHGNKHYFGRAIYAFEQALARQIINLPEEAFDYDREKSLDN